MPEPTQKPLLQSNKFRLGVGVVVVAVAIVAFVTRDQSPDTQSNDGLSDVPSLQDTSFSETAQGPRQGDQSVDKKPKTVGSPPPDPELVKELNAALHSLERGIKYTEEFNEGRKNYLAIIADYFFERYKKLAGQADILELPESFVTRLESLERGDTNIDFALLLEDVQRYQLTQLKSDARQREFEKSFDNLKRAIKDAVSDPKDIRKDAISDESRKLLIHQDLEVAEFSEDLDSALEALAQGNYAGLSLLQIEQELLRYQIGRLSLEERQAGYGDSLSKIELTIDQILEENRTRSHAQGYISEQCSLLLRYHESLEGTEAARPALSESFRAGLESLAQREYADAILVKVRQDLLRYQIAQLSLEERQISYNESLHKLELTIDRVLEEDRIEDHTQGYITKHCNLLLGCHESLEGTEAARPALSESFRSGLESLARGEYTEANLVQVGQELLRYQIAQLSLKEKQAGYVDCLDSLEYNMKRTIVSGHTDTVARNTLIRMSHLLLRYHESLEGTEAAKPVLPASLKTGLESLGRKNYSELAVLQLRQDLQNYQIGQLSLEVRQQGYVRSSIDLMRAIRGALKNENDGFAQREMINSSSLLLTYHRSLEGTKVAKPSFPVQLRAKLVSLARGENRDSQNLWKVHQDLQRHQIGQLTLEEKQEEFISSLDQLESIIRQGIVKSLLNRSDQINLMNYSAKFLILLDDLDGTKAAKPKISASLRKSLELITSGGDYTTIDFGPLRKALRDYFVQGLSDLSAIERQAWFNLSTSTLNDIFSSELENLDNIDRSVLTEVSARFLQCYDSLDRKESSSVSELPPELRSSLELIAKGDYQNVELDSVVESFIQYVNQCWFNEMISEMNNFSVQELRENIETGDQEELNEVKRFIKAAEDGSEYEVEGIKIDLDNVKGLEKLIKRLKPLIEAEEKRRAGKENAVQWNSRITSDAA